MQSELVQLKLLIHNFFGEDYFGVAFLGCFFFWFSNHSSPSTECSWSSRSSFWTEVTSYLSTSLNVPKFPQSAHANPCSFPKQLRLQQQCSCRTKEGSISRCAHGAVWRYFSWYYTVRTHLHGSIQVPAYICSEHNGTPKIWHFKSCPSVHHIRDAFRSDHSIWSHWCYTPPTTKWRIYSAQSKHAFSSNPLVKTTAEKL